MKYQGNNPVGLALADDPHAELRDAVLQQLDQFKSAAEARLRDSAAPATYQRHLAAASCAALCAQVVTEFHAVCTAATAEPSGRTTQAG